MTQNVQPAAMRPHESAMPWRALLADDHEMVRDALSQLLERLDPKLQVHQARNVAEVLAILRADAGYSLLLLDYHMPGMNGVHTIERVRQEFPNLSVGVITGYASHQEIEPLIAAGAIGVFAKTMSGLSLLVALKQAMAGQVHVPWSGDLPNLELARQGSAAPAAVLPDLSDRQKQVLTYVVTGSPNKEIARRLGLSEVTIKIHVSALCRKFSVANRTQLATTAMSAGIRPANG